MMEPDRYLGWLALALAPGLGARNAQKLVERFKTAEAIFTASLTELEACGVPARVAQAIHSRQSMADAEAEWNKAKQLGCRLLAWEDAEYPSRLKQIYDPPLLLYLRGDASVLETYSIAVVGTRHPTPYGNGVAEQLASDLAVHGLTIVSGLARGIDTAAHRGALRCPTGRTIAVLGSGIDVIYPRENRRMFETIEKRGAIITEFPIGTGPLPENFPVRNRIISGLSLGAVVVEAAQYSGSLITARLAMDQNREVYGVPGNITNKTSFGPNHLIKQGAKLVTTWEDVVDELPTEIRAELVPVETTPVSESASLWAQSLTMAEKTLYGLLSTDESRHVDELLEASGLNSSEVLATLLELEMKGLIRQMPGKYFVRVFHG
ncbi:MAG TPA: DNA-processing protein DprA [Candidatus Acidoferrales bacterium]